MSDPPPNILPSDLLLLLARLTWRFTVLDPSGLQLGLLVDGQRDLQLASTATGWRAFEALPQGLGPVLLCRFTFDMLKAAVSVGDGLTVTYDGRPYRVHTYFTGAHWTARALPVAA
jgi:hypothetical protein